jgi:MFS family permease
VLTASLFATFSLASGSALQWLALWSGYSLAALAIRNTVWTAAISSLFTAGRGLALGFTLSGTALTATFAPVVAQRLIDDFGWRNAYLYMGLGWGAIVLLLLALFFFDARDRQRLQQARTYGHRQQAIELPGLSFAEALRDRALIKIALAAIVFVLLITGISIHLVPILNERGLSRETAAVMAGLAGGMAFAGRLVTGWMLDRWAKGWINFANLASPALTCLILVLASNNLFWTTLAVVILGYANGAFMQVCAYLTSRYGGIRNFGKIFGILSSIVALGLGVGPLIASLIFDVTGSYTSLLIGAVPAAIVSGMLVSALGPYPVWSTSAQENSA